LHWQIIYVLSVFLNALICKFYRISRKRHETLCFCVLPVVEQMNDLMSALTSASQLVWTGDAQLAAIVWLSVKVSAMAVVFACLLGLPLGAWLALSRFSGRSVIIAVLNGLMGLPPVVIGLLVYLMLSRSGPLGSFGILFTPTAMVIAQAILITPIIAALSRQVMEDAWGEYKEQLTSLNASKTQALATLLWEMRFTLLTAVLAGFGRAAAEVGAVMIVGGNIDGVTRVMTTAIALETSKGDLALAMALGFVLMALVILVNLAAQGLKVAALRRYG
jgi:tungstate transport system permease protein